MTSKKFLNSVIKLCQIEQGELYNLEIFACRKLFRCCFSYLRPFLPTMNDIKVKSAIHHESDFDLFAINSSAVYLAETTCPFLGIKQTLIQE